MARAGARPTVFIGSSTPALPVARALRAGLADIADVSVWDVAFDAGTWLLGSILTWAQRADFGLFVVRADDVSRIKGSEFVTVRDNVLFELGVFMGALGPERTILMWPAVSRAAKPMRLPTDLEGLLRESYTVSRGKRPRVEVSAALPRIRKRVVALGRALRSGYNEIAALRQALDERELECDDGEFVPLGSIVRQAARRRRRPWHAVTSVAQLTQAMKPHYDHELVDLVFWWLVIYGVISFDNVEVWSEGGWDYKESLDYAVLTDRGVALLNELRMNGREDR